MRMKASLCVYNKAAEDWLRSFVGSEPKPTGAPVYADGIGFCVPFPTRDIS